jgi:hypothetical protein
MAVNIRDGHDIISLIIAYELNEDKNVKNEEKFYVQLQSILDNNIGRIIIIFYQNVRVDNSGRSAIYQWQTWRRHLFRQWQ